MSNWAEIVYQDTYEGPLRWWAPPLKPAEGVFKIPVWGHISGADQDIFTKFGVYVENGVLQHVEWFIHIRLEYPRWRMAAKSNYLNRYNGAADCLISQKFCTMTDIRVLQTMLVCEKHSGQKAPPH